jgi:hypothetical protein
MISGCHLTGISMMREVFDMNRCVLVLFTVVSVSLAREASAQGFLNAFVGTTLTSPSDRGSSSKPGFGAALGSVGKIVGAETEVAYYPELLDNTANALSKSKVITFSGNTLIGPRIGPVKVYGAVGVGNLHLNVTSLSNVLVPNPADFSSNYFTVNGGGGVMGFFAPHLGVRADLRYYKAYGLKITDLENAGLALDKFNFWRANVGVVLTF